ncbi:MAG: inositol monophosphatase [Chlamydiae bacterium]|nr:inositol monophosphatase [Chlamydiota bacterium]
MEIFDKSFSNPLLEREMATNQNQIAQLKEAAIMAAMAAGEELKNGFYKDKQIKQKTGHHDLVTDFDQLSENAILDIVQKQFPHHSFVTEESGLLGDEENSFIWCIDPLDGTWNFAHNIPTFSVSISVLYEKEPVIGVIYHPLLSELFIAEKGKGAFLNGSRIYTSHVDVLELAGLSLGISFHQEKSWILDRLRKFAEQHPMIRRSGSAALDMAYVAAGRLDGFIEASLWNWDFAAGALLIEEAGGIITDLKGQRLNYTKKQSILGSNKHIHRELLHFFHT